MHSLKSYLMLMQVSFRVRKRMKLYYSDKQVDILLVIIYSNDLYILLDY